MREDRSFYIKQIAKYAEAVNGFAPQKSSLEYWHSLPELQLVRVYQKWKDLYEKEVIQDER